MHETVQKNQNSNDVAVASGKADIESKPAVKSHKGEVITIVVILVVCALAVGGFFGYRYYKLYQKQVQLRALIKQNDDMNRNIEDHVTGQILITN